MKKLCLFILIFVLVQNCYSQLSIPKDFKEFTVKSGKEKYKAYKGNIYVKEKHSDPNSRLMYLPIIIYKSLSPSPEEPIFWFAGGPGQSNLNNRYILEKHDFITVGYRGVDGEVKLNSKKIGKSLKGVNNQLLSDKSLDNMAIVAQAYLKELADKNIDLKNYTIIDVIDDFESVRKTLGCSKINLLSISYGTRVALLYSYRYPDAINRSVMFGANPPGYFVWYPEKTTQIIKLYDSIYQSTTQSKAYIEQDITNALKNMPKRWSLFKLDRDKIKTMAFTALSGKGMAVMAFDAFHKAATKKDYSGLYLMQIMYDFGATRMNYWGDMYNKAATADLNCNTDYKKILQGDSLSIGSPYAYLLWGNCTKAWSTYTINEKYRKVDTSYTQTLIVSANLDINTPTEYATKELLPYLPNGKQIILKDIAHVDLFNGPSENLFCKYFESGLVDTSGYKLDPIVFKSKINLCRMAKIWYPVIAVRSLFN